MRAETLPATTRAGARARVLGIVFILTGVLIAVVFGLGAHPGVDSRLGLNPARNETFIVLPDLVLPSAGTAYALATVCMFLGGVQLARGFRKRANLVLGIVALIFVFAFLVWAARDRSLSLLGMFQSTLLRSVPITFGALAGVLCERVGVINIAIEGMLLLAAFAAAVSASVVGNIWVGLLVGAVVGGLVAWVLAILSIRYRIDQIIGGTVINIFALGMTGYLSIQFLQNNAALNDPGRFQNVAIP